MYQISRGMFAALGLFCCVAGARAADLPTTSRPVNSKPPTYAIQLFPIPDQMAVLKRLDFSCFQDIAGNYSKQGFVSQIVLVEDARAVCVDGEGPSVGPDTTLVGQLIELNRRFVNLVRIDISYGGSGTLRRYVTVTVVKRVGLKNNSYLLVRELLPPTIELDEDAKNFANRSRQ